MKIGIDIDDTLCETFETIYPYVLDFFKDSIPNLKNIKLDKTLRKIVTNYGGDYTEFCKKYYDKLLINAKAKENASEVLKKLKKEGNEIIIITARTDKAYNYPYETSYQFLINNNIPFDKLIVGRIDKGKACVEEKIDVFIDDNLDNCYDIKNHGVNVILFDGPLNQDNNDFKRVRNFNELYEMLRK